MGTLILFAGFGPFFTYEDISADPGLCFWHCEETCTDRAPLKCELSIPDHPAVDIWAARFSETSHCSFQAQLDRSHFYAESVREVFISKGLPKDLIYVALIESGFCPEARSHANAVGIWQIVMKTANRFGLAEDKWVDERRNPTKAARAAANYLSLLYNKFGSWSLALAAYNAGETCVQNALDKSGLKTFWDLMERSLLPSETCDYVPKVFAAIKIIRDPEFYGFHFEEEEFIPKQETVSVPGGLKLSRVGKLIGVPQKILQKFNPELCQSATPPGCSLYKLCLPAGRGEDLVEALAKHPQPEDKGRGGLVSRSFVPASHKTKAWLSLRRLGTAMTLKFTPGESYPVISKAGRNSEKERAAADSPQKSLHYVVRRGDTLSSIACRFHISIKTLCAQNKVNPNQKLAAGNALVISSRSETILSAKKKIN